MSADPTVDPVITRLAVERVYELVRDRFATEAPEVVFNFGWRYLPNQMLQGEGRANRVIFVPGDDVKAGEYLDARYPGKLSRALRTMLEPVTVYCWACDMTDVTKANDPKAQWRACRMLLDAVVRACDLALRQLAGLHDQKPFSGAEWVLPDTERTFGACCRFVLTLMSTVPDELPDLSGPTRFEVTNAAPDLTPQIGPTEEGPWEDDPPDLTPADDP